MPAKISQKAPWKLKNENFQKWSFEFEHHSFFFENPKASLFSLLHDSEKITSKSPLLWSHYPVLITNALNGAMRDTSAAEHFRNLFLPMCFRAEAEEARSEVT